MKSITFTVLVVAKRVKRFLVFDKALKNLD